jgi:hypothetical protein
MKQSLVFMMSLSFLPLLLLACGRSGETSDDGAGAVTVDSARED